MINIEKLAIEAGFYANPEIEKFEKFAELIVLECASIALGHIMLISNFSDAEFVDKQIKEHFGID